MGEGDRFENLMRALFPTFSIYLQFSRCLVFLEKGLMVITDENCIKLYLDCLCVFATQLCFVLRFFRGFHCVNQ